MTTTTKILLSLCAFVAPSLLLFLVGTLTGSHSVGMLESLVWLVLFVTGMYFIWRVGGKKRHVKSKKE
jgi:hypothetical protein